MLLKTNLKCDFVLYTKSCYVGLCYNEIQLDHIDGLVQRCRISNVLAMEILQSCTKPSIWNEAKIRVVHVFYFCCIALTALHMINHEPLWLTKLALVLVHGIHYICIKLWNVLSGHILISSKLYSMIARFMGPTWGPSGANRTPVSPMSAPWTLLSGFVKVVCDVMYIPTCTSVLHQCHWSAHPYNFTSLSTVRQTDLLGANKYWFCIIDPISGKTTLLVNYLAHCGLVVVCVINEMH